METISKSGTAFKVTPYLVLLLFEFCLELTECVSQAEVNRHLELGKQCLARHQLGDALNHYHSAVEGDPNNYLTYFKRCTVYLALGKANKALQDIDKTLEIKPDFLAARVRRGQIHLKQGDYDLAQLDFYNVLQTDPYNMDANELLQQIDPAKQNKQNAEYYYAHNDYVSAISYLNGAIESSPWAAKLFEFRSELHLGTGDTLSAISDMSTAAKLYNDNREVYFKLSQMLYENGDAAKSIKSIRECLKLDPDDKQCFPFYKRIKKVEKYLTTAETAIENNDGGEAIDDLKQVLKLEKNVFNIINKANVLLCTAYVQGKQYSEAIAACTNALGSDEEQNAQVYCDRAEAYTEEDLFDDAVRDYNEALKLNGDNARAKEGLQKAKQRQKQSERRDYYKILGVARTASKAEIVKAYRKKAQKWHPDNYQNDEKMKKVAEKNFIDIAAAKEVLTDDEKRKQFDSGTDPLDPESGHQNNFHGGGQTFHFFHDSPFQHFKFNHF